jgi:hypothetical protein
MLQIGHLVLHIVYNSKIESYRINNREGPHTAYGKPV